MRIHKEAHWRVWLQHGLGYLLLCCRHWPQPVWTYTRDWYKIHFSLTALTPLGRRKTSSPPSVSQLPQIIGLQFLVTSFKMSNNGPFVCCGEQKRSHNPDLLFNISSSCSRHYCSSSSTSAADSGTKKQSYSLLWRVFSKQYLNHSLTQPSYPTIDSHRPVVLFLPAVRPRFTQPAKMRKRVIARPVGSSVRLKCTASGNPRPDIVWLKDSRPLADEDSGAGGDGQKKKKWTLSLKNLTPEHSGKYTCHVSNRAGEINATYKLEVIREYFDSIIGEKGF